MKAFFDHKPIGNILLFCFLLSLMISSYDNLEALLAWSDCLLVWCFLQQEERRNRKTIDNLMYLFDSTQMELEESLDENFKLRNFNQEMIRCKCKNVSYCIPNGECIEKEGAF